MGETENQMISSKDMLVNVVLRSISRLQLPDREFVTRNIYYANWKTTDSDCCKNTSKIEWHSIIDISEGKFDKLWGSEVSEFAKSLNELEVDFAQKLTLNEFTSSEVFKHLLKDDQLNRLDKNSTVVLIHELLEKTGYNQSIIIKIYSDFIYELCFISRLYQ